MLAGVLSGVAGLMVFLVIHHFWIKPIWFILPLGLVIAGLGGLGIYGTSTQLASPSMVHRFMGGTYRFDLAPIHHPG